MVLALAFGGERYRPSGDDGRPADEAAVPGRDPFVAERNVAVPKGLHRFLGRVERHLDVVVAAIHQRDPQHNHGVGKHRVTRAQKKSLEPVEAARPLLKG